MAESGRGFEFFATTRIKSGRGVARQLGDEVRGFGGARALVVADPGVRATGLVDPIVEGLRGSGIDVWVFDQVAPNPTTDNVYAAYAALREHDCSVVLAVGGGSAIDCAKVAAVLATNGGSIDDYAFPPRDRYSVAPLPLIAIPTTVGTGSEVTLGAVISDPVRGEKLIVVGRTLQPRLAVLDPELVAKLPPKIAAGSGLDALTHAVEGYTSRNASPFSDVVNLGAIEIIGRSLRQAVAGDAEALAQMQIASCMTGMGFPNAGLGLVHALANVAGGFFNTHHGTTNGVLLPYVMQFNLASNRRKFADVALALGEPADGQDEATLAQRSAEIVRQLVADVGLPARLRDLGVDPARIADMAELALVHLDAPTNPRDFTREDIIQLYEQAV